jgi:hemerythrin-like domain-containing protein
MSKYEGIKIMTEEHRTLAAVLHALEFLSKPDQLKNTEVRVLWAIIHYMDMYSEKLHHPAEDVYLFKPLKDKSKDGLKLIAELEVEHADGDVRIKRLSNALDKFVAGVKGSDQDFSKAVDEYAQFYWKHMMNEEKVIFPIAEKCLSESDWNLLIDGFKKNKDPISGGEVVKNMDALLAKILEIAPSPIGFGDK